MVISNVGDVKAMRAENQRLRDENQNQRKEIRGLEKQLREAILANNKNSDSIIENNKPPGPQPTPLVPESPLKREQYRRKPAFGEARLSFREEDKNALLLKALRHKSYEAFAREGNSRLRDTWTREFFLAQSEEYMRRTGIYEVSNPLLKYLGSIEDARCTIHMWRMTYRGVSVGLETLKITPSGDIDSLTLEWDR